MARKSYSMLWRNKYLGTSATTFDEFITALESAVKMLKDMQAAGVKIDLSSAQDDYVYFSTFNKKTAKLFDFEEDRDDEFDE